MATNRYYLPSKALSFLARIHAEYVSDGKAMLAEILGTSRVFVVEETSDDHPYGGRYGHDVKLFMPPDQLIKIRIKEQKKIADEITADLNACAASCDNEFFRYVIFETENEDDSECQQSIPLFQRQMVNPEKLKIWKPDQVRLFISHRDAQKLHARSLAVALECYGISAFVAHDTIEPMSTWVNEILKGLQTMEIMLAFVTDDFHDSDWTNQEIGYALGRDVPIISLKLQTADPRGFIGGQQPLEGRFDEAAASATEIYGLIANRLGNRKRLQSALISAFVESTDFNETIIRFDRLNSVVDTPTDDELKRIVNGFRANSQLYKSFHLTNKNDRLIRLLEHCTPGRYEIKDRMISPVIIVEPDEIPF